MAATIELKYFNSFWLKKMKTITSVVPSSTSPWVSNTGTTFVIGTALNATKMNVGQKITFTYTSGSDTINYSSYIVSRISDTSFVANATPSPVITTPIPVITFGKIINFDNIPSAYAATAADDWYEEESRIRGGYNNTSVDFGVRAFVAEDNPEQTDRFNSLIYSGVFNPRTAVNNTNQFSVGEDISRSLDPVNASIQKLYAEDTNLIIFQEAKVSRALIDKDAIYSAEGNPITTNSNLVIGQIVAYAGEYGISKDPFSFAVYGYRKYFTDRNRNVVCRLSKDGITEISSYGMHDFFRDKLSSSSVTSVVGSWDIHSKNYVLAIKDSVKESYTVAFDEDVLGWTSTFSYYPDYIKSVGSEFYSFKNGALYKHFEINSAFPNTYANFYNTTYDSTVSVVLNGQPSLVKTFKTINYEGGTEWSMSSLTASLVSSGVTPTDFTNSVLAKSLPINKYVQATSLSGLENQIFTNNFKRKENKYFAKIVNNTSVMAGEIFSGQQTSGVQGYFATVNFKLRNSTANPLTSLTEGVGLKELFAVSTDYVESSY